MESIQVEKITNYWLSSAEYDLDVSQSLFEKEKYHYSLFFGHLALEKILKALFVNNKKKHSPITHSLPQLAEKAELKLEPEGLEKLAQFMEFYIEGRYPKDLDVVFKKCNKEFTEKNLNEMKEMFQWLKKKLKKL